MKRNKPLGVAQPAPDPDDADSVSLRPSDMLPAALEAERELRDLVSIIQGFTPDGDRDRDRLSLSLPPHVWLAVGAVRGKASTNAAGCWLLGRGVDWLASLPAVIAIRTAQSTLADLEIPGLALDDWPYALTSRGTPTRLHLREVHHEQKKEACGLARGLGLPISKLGCVAIIAALSGVPLRTGRLLQQLKDEVLAFQRALEQRAVWAAQLVAAAEQQAPDPAWRVRPLLLSPVGAREDED